MFGILRATNYAKEPPHVVERVYRSGLSILHSWSNHHTRLQASVPPQRMSAPAPSPPSPTATPAPPAAAVVGTGSLATATASAATASSDAAPPATGAGGASGDATSAPSGGESLEDLVRLLKSQIGKSDWLASQPPLERLWDPETEK